MKPKKLMKISELFSLSWKIYDNKFWSLMGLIVFPGLFFLIYFLFSTIVIDFLPEGAVLTSPAIIIYSILFSAVIVFFYILIILSQLALALVVKENPTKFSIFTMLKRAAEYFSSYLWLIFLGSLLVALWAILFIIPGIIFMIYYSFSIWVFLDLGLKGKAALNKSKELVKSYWWSVFGKLMIPLIIFIIIISIPTFFMEPESFIMDVYDIIANIFIIAIMPFVASYLFNIYKNLKEIKA